MYSCILPYPILIKCLILHVFFTDGSRAFYFSYLLVRCSIVTHDDLRSYNIRSILQVLTTRSFAEHRSKHIPPYQLLQTLLGRSVFIDASKIFLVCTAPYGPFIPHLQKSSYMEIIYFFSNT